LWLGGPGTSKMILDRYAEVLGRFLPSPWPADPGRCVDAIHPLQEEVAGAGDVQSIAVGEEHLLRTMQQAFGGPGTSKMILDRYAEVLGRFLPSPWPADPGRCVEVNLFSRYPLRSVSDPSGHPAAEGLL
ncbi:hypothetical protein QM291_30825, partial [Pseudomonas aeruginosa]|nr:hypothetical protein [Pseudomonas aeruginosa]